MSFNNLDNESKLQILLSSATKDRIKMFIKNYNEYCEKNNLKEYKLRGYSKFNKSDLIDFILNSLPDEEKIRILPEIEEETINNLYNDAFDILLNKNPREKLKDIEYFENFDRGYKIKFKGWNWETETEIILTDEDSIDDFRCTCRISQDGGLCVHFFAGLISLINQNKINPDNLGLFFKFTPEQIQEIKKFKIEKEPEPRKIEDEILLGILGDYEKLKVRVLEGKISFIDKYSSKFQDHETIYYIIGVENGIIEAEIDEELIQEKFNIVSVRCSENAMNKYNLKIGDIITFKGSLENDRKHGLLIKNVRKFEIL